MVDENREPDSDSPQLEPGPIDMGECDVVAADQSTPKLDGTQTLDAATQQPKSLELRSRCGSVVSIHPLHPAHTSSTPALHDSVALPQNIFKTSRSPTAEAARPILLQNTVLKSENERLLSLNSELRAKLAESEAGRDSYRTINSELVQKVVKMKEVQRGLIDATRAMEEKNREYGERKGEEGERCGRESVVMRRVQRTHAWTVGGVVVVCFVALVVRVVG